MLSSAELQLLTACVDGELSDRQRRQVVRLLRSKPEARKLLAQLRRDSGRLKASPLVPAPANLADRVLDAVARLPQPRQLQPARHSRPAALPLWAGYAAAAAVLFAVACASYLLHIGNSRPVGNKGIIVKNRPEPEGPATPKKAGPAVAKNTPDPLPPLLEVPPVRVVDENDEPEMPDEGMPLPPSKPPVVPRRPVLASGQMEPLGQLERVELSQHKLHILHGLDVLEQGLALKKQLSSAAAFRIEIPARSATRGFERVRAALAGSKTHLVLDANVQAAIKKPAWRADFAIFLENISPDDLADSLRVAGCADRAATRKKAADRCFDGPLIVKELTRWDRRDLRALLGLDPAKVRPGVKPHPVDIRKPLEEGTGKQVADALEGRGVPRPGSTVRLPGSGIAMLYLGARGRTVELQQFLEKRQPARPGTVQVLLVVRHVGG